MGWPCLEGMLSWIGVGFEPWFLQNASGVVRREPLRWSKGRSKGRRGKQELLLEPAGKWKVVPKFDIVETSYRPQGPFNRPEMIFGFCPIQV